MANTEAHAIVDTALSLLRTHPHASALDILDLAMQGREGSDLNFEVWSQPFSDWTDTSSPFGELLGRAFASDRIGRLAAAPVASGELDEAYLADTVSSSWQAEVMDLFAQRYRLWGTGA